VRRFKLLRLLFPIVQLDLVSLASPDIIHAVADAMSYIGVMVFRKLKLNKQVDFCYVGGVDFYCRMSMEFPLAELRVCLNLDLCTIPTNLRARIAKKKDRKP